MATVHRPTNQKPARHAQPGQPPKRQPAAPEAPVAPVAPEPDERQQREGRILDAATALLVRWGYRKTTIDDVAREAGVGKGTIYLHWKDKNELFRAAIWREQHRYLEDIKRRVDDDPEGGLLHRVTTHSMIAALCNPLMAAMIKDRSDIFNGFLGSFSPNLFDQAMGDIDAYIIRMQQAGLIRRDLSLPAITYLMIALKIGFVNAPDYLSQENMPGTEQLTEALSDLIRRWLEPEQLPGQSEAGKQSFAELINKTKESE